MPEGDTIFRAAAKLRESITGATILAAESKEPNVDAESLRDRVLGSIEALGKHVLMHLDDRRVIHSHMGMTGSWHVYGPDQTWRKPASRAGLVLKFDVAVAVCFSPKLLEVLTAGELKQHRYLTRLGPDLLAPEIDEVDVLLRFRHHDRLPIGEAVMDQTVVSGIGNVYKSELLFLDGIHPLTKVINLPDESILSIVRRARKLLKRNLHGGPRRTRFRGDGHNVWVYGRQGEVCLKCNATIQVTRQGELGRTTYLCPVCQPVYAQ